MRVCWPDAVLVSHQQRQSTQETHIQHTNGLHCAQVRRIKVCVCYCAARGSETPAEKTHVDYPRNESE